MTKIIKIINKNNLSWKAKGIYTVIHDNYKHMDITVEFLSKISTDSISSITSGIKELLDLKLIKRVSRIFSFENILENEKECANMLKSSKITMEIAIITANHDLIWSFRPFFISTAPSYSEFIVLQGMV